MTMTLKDSVKLKHLRSEFPVLQQLDTLSLGVVMEVALSNEREASDSVPQAERYWTSKQNT